MPVSTLAISSGAATAVRTVNGCIEKPQLQLPHVGQPSEHRCRSDHGGTHDVGERAAALAAFVIAVGRRGTTFAWRDELAVRAVAHRAAGIPPLEAGRDKNTIEPFRLGPPL